MSWGVSLGRNPLHIPWGQFMDEVAAAGYAGVELGTWGYLPTLPSRLRNELDQRGLALAGAQLNADFPTGDAWPAAIERTKEVCDLIRMNGANRLVLLSTYNLNTTDPHRGPTYANARVWAGMIDRIHEVALVAQQQGVLAVYHPHAGGGIESEAEIERFLADTNPDLVSLCFDTGHHAYCGGDVLGFIRSHSDRFAHVHLKNVNRAVLDDVRREGLTFSEACWLGVMTELELGLIDFASVRDALFEVSFDGWGVVEQDRSQASTEPPLALATRNRKFLSRLNFS